MNVEGQDPKSALNQFCQSYCKKPVTKTCIVYTTAKYGEQYQTTVKLNCIDGQEFAGEVASNSKIAEKLAAQQALNHFQEAIATMPAAGKKRKAEPGLGGITKVGKVGTELAGGPGAMWGAPSVPSPGTNNPKMMLNTVCMKLAKRTLQKGDMVFEVAETPLGFQCTVQLPCLPGEMGQSVWAGEVAQNKKQAEQNAAKIALENVSPESLALCEASVTPSGGGGWQGGKGTQWDMWKGMDKGMGKGMAMMGMGKGMGKGMFKGKTKRPSGDNLPRERITQVPVTGDILEWKEKFGWVKPHAPIEHAMAGKNKGKIFLSHKDFTGSDPAVGSTVQFQVYADASGLGAEEAYSL